MEQPRLSKISWSFTILGAWGLVVKNASEEELIVSVASVGDMMLLSDIQASVGVGAAKTGGTVALQFEHWKVGGVSAIHLRHGQRHAWRKDDDMRMTVKRLDGSVVMLNTLVEVGNTYVLGASNGSVPEDRKEEDPVLDVSKFLEMVKSRSVEFGVTIPTFKPLETEPKAKDVIISKNDMLRSDVEEYDDDRGSKYTKDFTVPVLPRKGESGFVGIHNQTSKALLVFLATVDYKKLVKKISLGVSGGLSTEVGASLAFDHLRIGGKSGILIPNGEQFLWPAEADMRMTVTTENGCLIFSEKKVRKGLVYGIKESALPSSAHVEAWNKRITSLNDREKRVFEARLAEKLIPLIASGLKIRKIEATLSSGKEEANAK